MKSEMAPPNPRPGVSEPETSERDSVVAGVVVLHVLLIVLGDGLAGPIALAVAV
jgi:hypothetical protein